MTAPRVIFTHCVADELNTLTGELTPTLSIVIYPEQAGELLLPKVLPIHGEYRLIPHASGEENKTIDTVADIWRQMLSYGADRRSSVINLGGGMTSDIGGFAAACYMRSIPYINVPTTLLGAVDAACGGKTGVNLAGVKNIVGAFRMPYATVIYPGFLQTLPSEQILSGWGEILKHALLISPESIHGYLSLDPMQLSQTEWMHVIRESVQFKNSVVEADPHERGLRKILNLGHTAGHAFEAFFSDNRHADVVPVSHGHAVATGMVTALVLSHMIYGFDSVLLHQFADTVRRLYPPLPVKCSHYQQLLSLMHHDKKNRGCKEINFVLLKAPGTAVPVCAVDDIAVGTALDITRDLLCL